MTQNHSSTAVEQEAPVVPLDAGAANLELAESLREVAHWVELHAGDLPTLRASLAIAVFGERARDVLTAVGEALGDRAEESVNDNGHIEVGGHFGPVHVYAWTTPSSLGGVEVPRPVPAYDPVLAPAADPPVTPQEDEAWRERSDV